MTASEPWYRTPYAYPDEPRCDTPHPDGGQPCARRAQHDVHMRPAEQSEGVDAWIRTVVDPQPPPGETAREAALRIAAMYGQIDGTHHRAWVIDQMTRALLGAGYDAWIANYRSGEDGPHTYGWDEGIMP